MTLEQKKNYLRSYRMLDREIQIKVDRLAYLRARSTKATPSWTGMPRAKSTSASQMEDLVIKIVQLENEVNADIDRLYARRQRIEADLEQMENPVYRILLEYRYINCLTWEEMTEQMHYSYQHLHRLHNAALKEFEPKKSAQ